MPKDSAMYDTLAKGAAADDPNEPDADDPGGDPNATEPAGDPELEMHARTIFGDGFTPEKQAALKEFVAACMAAPDDYGGDMGMADTGAEMPA